MVKPKDNLNKELWNKKKSQKHNSRRELKMRN
jgi:hypothetical protein